VTASFLLAALIVCVHERGVATPSQGPAARRVVLVGIDAADWLAIDPLVRAGRLPTFARLRSHGRTGVMLSTPPLISPMIWTTIATGVEPENHGILDFMADLPDGRQMPVGSSQRLAPALWNHFSQAGRRVGVVGWWATWPAELVNGTIVSDALAPQIARGPARSDRFTIAPAAGAQPLLSLVVPVRSVTYEDLSAYAPVSRAQYNAIARTATAGGRGLYGDPVSHLAAVVAGTRTYSAIARELLRSQKPDFFAVYLESVDTLSHLFVKTAGAGGRAKAIERAYEDADALLRGLAELSPADTLVVVCSDHGFHPPTAGVAENPSDLTGPATAWHRPYGIVAVATAGALAGSPGATRPSGPASLGIVTPLDIAPTILHGAGLPVPAEFPGRIVREMLPDEAAKRDARRSAMPPYTRAAMPDMARGDNEEAVARLQALGYVGASRTSLARQNLGESLLRRGKLAAAERELRAVLEAQPRNLSVNLWLAQALVRQGRGPAALAVYERSVALPGGAREALVAAVDLALASGNEAVARGLITSGESAADARAAVHVARGAVAEHQRQAARAEAGYRAALQSDPALYDAIARLHDLLAGAGRVTEALAAVERATRAVPDSPRHLALLGEARLAARDPAGAETALRRALDLAPDASEVRLALGRSLVAQRKYDQAIDAAAGAAPSADRDIVLGAAYSGKAEFQRALTHLQAALDGGHATPDVLNGIGYAHLRLGRTKEAAAMFERSLAVRANQPEIRRLLSDIRKQSPAGPR
jgi:tetratricopeptide (TPR) repeat protein